MCDFPSVQKDPVCPLSTSIFLLPPTTRLASHTLTHLFGYPVHLQSTRPRPCVSLQQCHVQPPYQPLPTVKPLATVTTLLPCTCQNFPDWGHDTYWVFPDATPSLAQQTLGPSDDAGTLPTNTTSKDPPRHYFEYHRSEFVFKGDLHCIGAWKPVLPQPSSIEVRRGLSGFESGHKGDFLHLLHTL